MSDKFETAVKIVQGLPEGGPVQPALDDKLQFYGWYKTVTVGAVTTARPGMLAFEAKAKWDAWKAVENTPVDDCKRLYVEKLIAILEKVESEDSTKYLAELK